MAKIWRKIATSGHSAHRDDNSGRQKWNLIKTFKNVQNARTCASLPTWMVSNENSVRIIGGTTAHSPIPWQVYLWYCDSSKRCWKCGGTILNERTVLSAAHCFGKYGKKGLYFKSIKAGVVNHWDNGQVSTISIRVPLILPITFKILPMYV